MSSVPLADDVPAASGPKLLNRLRKSISGQNLRKSSKTDPSDIATETQELNVQDTVPEEAEVEVESLEDKSEAAEVEETHVDDDEQPQPETHSVAPVEKPQKATGLRRLKSLAKFSKGGNRASVAVDSHASLEQDGIAQGVEVSADQTIAEVVESQSAQDHEAAVLEDSIDDNEQPRPEAYSDVPVDHVEKLQKVTGLKRLKSLAKFSKGGNRASVAVDPHQDGIALTEATADQTNAEVVEGQPAQDDAVATLEAPMEDDEDDKCYNDPTSLAGVIRCLVETLPRPTEPVPVPTKPKPPQVDKSGRPIPPPSAVHSDDEKLIAKLRNPEVMNGQAAQAEDGNTRPTVFAVLDSYRAPLDDKKDEEDEDDTDGEYEDGDDDESDNEEEPPHIIADDTSVMLYVPLIPTKKSKVEMAKSQLVPIDTKSPESPGNVIELLSTYRVYGTFGRGTVPPVLPAANEDGTKEVAQARFSWKWWPWRKKDSAPAPTPADPPATADPVTEPVGGDETKPTNEGDSSKPTDGTHDDKGKDDQEKDTKPEDGKHKKRPRKLRKPKPVLEQRVWVPSNTQVSVQALWWGYRIFLPPPVMAVLSDKTVEATKRAAMVTTALTWLFANLPTVFPGPMQPALLMLQHLVPYLGYIGTFITWSWSTVKSYDVGHGVILSATWVLPVALIPGTWQAYDFPTTGGTDTPSQPSTGAPSTTPPSTEKPTPTKPSTETPTPNKPSTETPTPTPAKPSTSKEPAPPVHKPSTPPSSTPPAGGPPHHPTKPAQPPTSKPAGGSVITPIAGAPAPLEPAISIGHEAHNSEDGQKKETEKQGEDVGYVGGIWRYFTGSG